MRVGTKRPGGRSADNLARIVAATGELLVEKGYGRLSTEEVAERAGVHRSTVHRRFPTRAELVAHLMTTLARERVPVPDTGSLAGDLLAFARDVRRATPDPIAGALTRAVVAEGGDRTELGAVSAASGPSAGRVRARSSGGRSHAVSCRRGPTSASSSSSWSRPSTSAGSSRANR